MASQGPRYPGTVTTEVGPSGDNDWTNPSNISANDGSEAQITAATYDANDHSYRLKAQNFGFSIPSGATIDGIFVEIEQRRFAGAAIDQEVRIYNAAGTLVGDEKANTLDAWLGTANIANYGGTTDNWNAGLTDIDTNDPDFGVAHIVKATAANTDIGVDFIRVTVHYTEAAPSGSGAISVPSVAVTGTGEEVFTATGAVSVPTATMAGSGEQVFTATSAVVVPAATVAGTGDHSEGAAPTGTGAISVPASTVVGVGELVFIATGAIVMPVSVVAALGSEVFTGTGAFSVLSPVIAGDGLMAEAATGTGAITVPAAQVFSGDGYAGGGVSSGGARSLMSRRRREYGVLEKKPAIEDEEEEWLVLE